MKESQYIPRSDLGWVDYSPRERDRLKHILSILSKPGTVDELGIGVVRDTFSDALFPGITTIMTRAKYFLTVPYIIRDFILYDHNKEENASQYLRDRENDIMNVFAFKSIEKDKDDSLSKDEKARYVDGIIGITIYKHNIQNGSKKELVRKPSAIYWNGLREFGIVQTDQSLNNFLKSLDAEKKNFQLYTKEIEFEDENPVNKLLKKNLPRTEKGWFDNVSIVLTSKEAEFLKNQIIDNTDGSLLNLLLKDDDLLNAFLKVSSLKEFHDFTKLEDSEVKKNLSTAIHFWEVLFGAHILYNIMYFKRYEASEKVRILREEDWNPWLKKMKRFDWNKLDTEYIWQLSEEGNHRIDKKTRNFIESWITECKRLDLDLESMSKLILSQEMYKKKARRKLSGPKSPDNYVKPDGDGWIGFQNMGFRFSNVKTILRDIQDGLS